nr:two-component regulator propeller domain-containing protein [uncultured Flavobacterium sp.]
MQANRMLFFILSLLIVSCAEKQQDATAKEFEKSTNTVAGDTVTEVGRSVRCIIQDSKNNFWFATDGEGVFKYDGKTIIQFRDEHGLASNYVWNIIESKDGEIWLRTRDAICSYNGNVFTRHTATKKAHAIYNPLAHELIAEYYYDGKKLMKIELPQTSPLKKTSRQHYDIYCSYKDRKGNVWFGTCTAGVCKYDGKTYTWLDDPELGAPVRVIFEDSKGNIWIGNNGYGLFRYDGKTLVNVTKEHKLENPAFLKSFESKSDTMARVWSVEEDTEGNLWIGTIDNNIWRFDGKSIVNFTTKDRIGTDAIWTIYRDKKDMLWFGTDGAGAYMLKGKSFVKLKVKGI